MVDPKHFQRLQHQFFKDYGKRTELKSSQILFSCFHPNSTIQGDVIIMLEQVYYPSTQQIYDMSVEREEECNELHIEEDDDVLKLDLKGKQQDNHQTIISNKLFDKQLTIRSSQKDQEEQDKSFGTEKDTSSLQEESMHTEDAHGSLDERPTMHLKEIQSPEVLPNGPGDEKPKKQFLQVSAEEEETTELKIKYNHQVLKYKIPEAQLIANRTTKKKMDMRESNINQFKRMVALGNKEINWAMKRQEEHDAVPSSILDRKLALKRAVFNKDQNKTTFIVSMWRLYQGKLPAMINNVEISSNQNILIFQDSLFYSHDGHYLFFMIMNMDQILQKMVVLNSHDLSVPETHEFDLTSYMIHADEIHDDPALLWGHKDSLNMPYAINRGSIRATATPGYGFTSQYLLQHQFQTHLGTYRFLEIPMVQEGIGRQYLIAGIFFENIKRDKFFSKNNSPVFTHGNSKKDPRKVMLVVKKNHITDPYNTNLKIYKSTFDKIQQKVKAVGALTFTDEMKTEQTISHEELSTPFLQCWANKDLKYLFIKTEPIKVQGSALVEEQDTEKKRSLVFMELIQKDVNEVFIKDLAFSNSSVQKANDGSSKILHYSQPSVIYTYREIAIQKNNHLREDMLLLLFNDNQQAVVSVKASEILLKGQSERPVKRNSDQEQCPGLVELSELAQVKVDGKIELDCTNCFDIIQDQFRRTLTLGINVIVGFIAKITLSIYDEDSALNFPIDKYQQQFINPVVVSCRNNNYIILNSIVDNTWQAQLKLKSYFLSFVELYGGSIEISGRVFHRSQSLFFLTVDDSNKIRLKILVFPVHLDYELKGCPNHLKNQGIYNLKSEYSVDFGSVNKERIIKAVLTKIDQNGQDILILILQYSNEILIRPFCGSTYMDQISTGFSKLPVLCNDVQMKNADKDTVYMFYHSIDGNGQQAINLLSISPNQLPKTTSIAEIKSSPIVSLQKFEEFILTMDEDLCIKRYKFSARTGKLRLYRESELCEEAGTMLRFYKSSNHIVMTDTEVYIGPQFFQSYNKKTQSSGKDTNELFESYRFKNVDDLTHNNLVFGPLMSLDNSLICYLQAQLNIDEDLERVSSFSKQQFFRSKRDTAILSHLASRSAKSPVLAAKPGGREARKFEKIMSSEDNTATARSMKAQNAVLGDLLTTDRVGEDKYIGDFEKVLEVEEIDVQEIMAKRQLSAQKLKYEMIVIPFLAHKEIQLMHKDDYFVEQVQFSTFTLNDDIFIMVQKKFYMFDAQGNPLRLKIPKQDSDLFLKQDLKILKISTNYMLEAGQVFLFGDSTHYHLFHLVLRKEGYSFQKVYQYDILQPKDKDSDYYLDVRPDKNGGLYQLLIEPDFEDNPVAKLTYNGNDCPSLDEVLNRALQQVQEQNQTTFEMQERERSLSAYKNVSMVDDNINTKANGTSPSDRSSKNSQKDDNSHFKYDFEILHNAFFIFKIGLNVFYYNLLQYDDQLDMKKIRLQLRPGVITQILQTQRSHIVQIVFLQQIPTKNTYIFTWDLEKNMEEHILVTPLNTSKPKDISVIKGVSERYNYFIPSKENAVYDLRYNYPLNFFNGVSACVKLMMKHLKEREKTSTVNQKTMNFALRENISTNLNELKFGSFANKMLGKSREQYGTLYMSYSYMDFQYMEYLCDCFQVSKIKDDKTQIKQLLLQFCKFKLGNGNNVLHVMATNEDFLTLYQRQIEHLLFDLEYKDGEQFIFAVVYPNNQGVTPLDIAVKEHAGRCVEIMLEILCIKPKHNYSKYVQKHFYFLLSLNSQSFLKFLSNCTFTISKHFKAPWGFPKDYMEFSYHTSYIDDDILQKWFLINQEDIYNLYQQIKADIKHASKTKEISMDEIGDYNCDQNEGFEYEDQSRMFDQGHGHNSNEKGDTQNIIFEGIEFSWIFIGRNAQKLIQYLKDVDEGSDIFNVKTIQLVVLFQWRHFKKSYIKYKLIPFFLNFVIVQVFATIPRDINLILNQPLDDQRQWERTKDGLGIIMIIFASYFLLLEIFKIMRKNFNLTNIMDWWYNLGVIVLFILDQSRVNYSVFCIVACYVTMLNFHQLALHLRVFDTFAVLISMLYYIMKDMTVFAIIFLCGVLCFGNCFFILQGIQSDFDSSGNQLSSIGLGNYGIVFLYTYIGALGNFDTSAFDTAEGNQWILWVIYFFSSFLLSIILLNLLIAIMTDTYDQVMQIQKEERLRAKCRLINENEFIFNRERLFKDSKYIIVASLDTVNNQSSDDWEGKLNSLQNYIDQKFIEESHKSINNFKHMKDSNVQIQDLIKNQESKINEVQNGLNKVLQQLKVAESKKKVKKLMQKQGNKIRDYIQAQFLKEKVLDGLKSSEPMQNHKKQKNPLLNLLEATSSQV